MKNKCTKITSFVVVMAVLSVASGCKSGLQFDRLGLPENILEDARVAYYAGDRSGVNNDYAQIDTGETVADGFAVEVNTDADEIMQKVTGDKKRYFISLPADAPRREHLFRALAAASIREDIKKNDQWKIRVLNTGLMKNNVSSLRLDDAKAKQYFIETAKKINTTVGANDVVVVNLDDFPAGLTAEEFFAGLTTPHVVALSSSSIDNMKFFADTAESDVIFPKGLNPGHLVKLIQTRLQRSKNITDESTQEKLAVMMAKMITALDPTVNLGSLMKYFALLEPLIDGDAKTETIEDDLANALAVHFNVNREFVMGSLQSKSLGQVSEDVKKNARAYSETRVKLDELLSRGGGGGGGGGGSPPPGGGGAPPPPPPPPPPGVFDYERIEKAVESAVTKINRKLGAHIDEAHDTTLLRTRQAVDELAVSFEDNLRRALRRASSENQKALDKTGREINANTERTVGRLVRRVIDDVNDNTTMVGKNVEKELDSNANRAIDATKAESRKLSAKVLADVSKILSERLEQARKRIQTNNDNNATSTEEAVQKALAMKTDELHEMVLASAKRVIAQQLQSMKGLRADVNQDSKAAMKRAEQVLASALSDTETQLKARVSDEAQQTRDEIATKLRRNSDKASRDVIAEVTKILTARLESARKKIQANTDSAVGMSEEALKNALTQESSELQGLVLANAKRIIREQTALAGTLTTKVNEHTKYVVKNAENVLADAISETEEQVKQQIAEEGQQSRDEIATKLRKEVAQAGQAVREHVTEESEKTKRALIRNNEAVAEMLRDEINDETRRQLETLINDMETSVNARLERLSAASLAEIKNAQTAVEGAVKKQGQVNADEIAEVKEIVREESEKLVAAVSDGTDETKAQAKKLNGVVKTMIPEILFYHFFKQEFVRIVAAADNVPTESIDDAVAGDLLPQRRRQRIENASTIALNLFRSGSTTLAIVNAAALAYTTVIAGAQAPSLAATADVTGATSLSVIVDTFKSFQSVNSAPRPLGNPDGDSGQFELQNSDENSDLRDVTRGEDPRD